MPQALTSIKDLAVVLSTDSVIALEQALKALESIDLKVSAEAAKELSKELLTRLDHHLGDPTKNPEQKEKVTAAKDLVESSYVEKQRALEEYKKPLLLLTAEVKTLLDRLKEHNTSASRLKELNIAITTLETKVEGLSCTIEAAVISRDKADTKNTKNIEIVRGLNADIKKLELEIEQSITESKRMAEIISRQTSAIEMLKKDPIDATYASQLKILDAVLLVHLGEQKELVNQKTASEKQLATLIQNLKVAAKNYESTSAEFDSLVKDLSAFNEALSTAKSSLADAKVAHLQTTKTHEENTANLAHSKDEAVKLHTSLLHEETPANAAIKAHDTACLTAVSKFGAGYAETVAETVATGVSSLLSFGYSCLPSLRAASTVTASALLAVIEIESGSDTEAGVADPVEAAAADVTVATDAPTAAEVATSEDASQAVATAETRKSRRRKAA